MIIKIEEKFDVLDPEFTIMIAFQDKLNEIIHEVNKIKIKLDSLKFMDTGGGGAGSAGIDTGTRCQCQTSSSNCNQCGRLK